MDLPRNSDRTQRIEIYKNAIDLEMQLYIESLPDPSLIYKVGPFRGLLKHISVNVFKADRILDKRTDRNIMFSDPIELDRLWDIFVSICYLYNQNISIDNFAMFIGVDYKLFQNWLNGTNRKDDNNIDPCIVDNITSENSVVLNNTSLYTSLVKKWINESRMNLEDHAMKENSVGSIFLLKALHGLAESPQRIEIAASSEKVDRAALMDKYKGQELPEKPKLTDNIDK